MDTSQIRQQNFNELYRKFRDERSDLPNRGMLKLLAQLPREQWPETLWEAIEIAESHNVTVDAVLRQKAVDEEIPER